MKCTEEQLKTIEEDAFDAMTATEIACHLGVAIAYRKGKAAAVKMAKEQVKNQAKIGNPDSLRQYLLNINDMADDE